MAYEDAKDYLFEILLPACRREIDGALESTGGTIANISDVLGEALLPDATLTNTLAPAAAARRAQQEEMIEHLLDWLDGALAWVGRELGSAFLNGGDVDRPGVIFDLANRMVADSEYIAARGATLAADPAADSGLTLRRLTEDHRGQLLDGGVRETVTFEVTGTALSGNGAGVISGVLYGEDGPQDDLDYMGAGTARASDVRMFLISDANPAGILSNPGFVAAGPPDNGDAVTELSGWTLTDQSGAPTKVWRTTNPWRDKTGGLAVAGNATTLRLEQPLILGNGNAYVPVDFMGVVYWDATWSGSITVTWGSKSQAFSSASFSGAGFKYLLPDLDSDLYPVNFSVTDAMFRVDVATTSASGEIVLQFFDAQIMTARQGMYFSAWAQATDPVERLKKTWADTPGYTGELQDTLQVLTGQAPWAYLPTDGTTELVAPALTAVLNVPASIVLGNVVSGAHDVDIAVENTGRFPLIVQIPTQGAVSNATLTDAGIAAAIVVMPGKTTVITVEVTDGGAGAFSCEVDFTGNGGDETVTISGTAT
jgi:hypothetical protein